MVSCLVFKTQFCSCLKLQSSELGSPCQQRALIGLGGLGLRLGMCCPSVWPLPSLSFRFPKESWGRQGRGWGSGLSWLSRGPVTICWCDVGSVCSCSIAETSRNFPARCSVSCLAQSGKLPGKVHPKETAMKCQGGEGFPAVGVFIYYFLPLQGPESLQRYFRGWDKAPSPQTPQRRPWSLRCKELLTKKFVINFYGKLTDVWTRGGGTGRVGWTGRLGLT